MGKYEDLAHFIIENVGEKENIKNVTHCMTRLRFSLNNEELINEKKLLNNSEIVTSQKSGGQYQVVIGTHVSDVYDEVTRQIGGDENSQEEPESKGTLNKFIDIITKVITPVLGILIASGLIQGLLAILTATGVVETTDGAYVILNAMGKALFTFFPVVLGYTSAKAFKMDGYVGMIIGASLVFPNIITDLVTGTPLYILFSGTILEMPIYQTFFGLPIIFPETGYTSTVIPIILAMYFASKIEKILKKVIPSIVGFTLVPFMTVLVSVPITILVVGPIANVASLLISSGISVLYTVSPILTTVVVGLIYQPLVILGLHWPLITIGINNFGILGYDYILPMIFTASFAQTAVVMAVYAKTKSAKTKGICVPAIISGLFCIIEPAIYGVTLPIKKRFVFSMIGGTIGGVILSALSIKMYTMSVGVLGIVSFINPETGSFSGLVIAIVATLITMVISFLLTYFTFNETIESEEETASVPKQLSAKKELTSPLKGSTLNLENAQDSVFSKGLLGNGIVILPTEGKVIAPCDGILTSIFPTGHAIGITSDTGIEILIHVGKDTVKLNGKYFTILLQQGDRIAKGDTILEFDIEKIEKAGYSTETPIVITNSDQFLDVINTDDAQVDYDTMLMTLIPAN